MTGTVRQETSGTHEPSMRRGCEPGKRKEFKRQADFPSARHATVDLEAVPNKPAKADADFMLRTKSHAHRMRLVAFAAVREPAEPIGLPWFLSGK